MARRTRKAHRSPTRSSAAPTPPSSPSIRSPAPSRSSRPPTSSARPTSTGQRLRGRRQASDGSLTDAQALVVRVLDVNERPRTSCRPGSPRTRTSRSCSAPRAAAPSDRRPRRRRRTCDALGHPGTLTLARRHGLVFEVGDGTADRSLTFTGSIADVNAALDGLVFTPARTPTASSRSRSSRPTPPSRDLSDASSTAIIVRPVNDPPALAPIGDLRVNAGTAAFFGATASDVDGPELTYSLAGAPAGAHIDPATGAFTWTPTAAQAPGTYTFDVVVSDGGNPQLSDRATITITVTAAVTLLPRPPPGLRARAAAQPAPGPRRDSHADAPPPLRARDDRARTTAPALTISVLENDEIPAAGASPSRPARPSTARFACSRTGASSTPPRRLRGNRPLPVQDRRRGRPPQRRDVEIVVELPERVAPSWIEGRCSTGARRRRRRRWSRERDRRTPASSTWPGPWSRRCVRWTPPCDCSPSPEPGSRCSGCGCSSSDAVGPSSSRGSRAVRHWTSSTVRGASLYRLRFDEGPVWSRGRRRRVRGRTWVPVRTRSVRVRRARSVAGDRARRRLPAWRSDGMTPAPGRGLPRVVVRVRRSDGGRAAARDGPAPPSPVVPTGGGGRGLQRSMSDTITTSSFRWLTLLPASAGA